MRLSLGEVSHSSWARRTATLRVGQDLYYFGLNELFVAPTYVQYDEDRMYSIAVVHFTARGEELR